jgi:hypothetical protein
MERSSSAAFFKRRSRMYLDVIVPTHVENLKLVPQCVEALDIFTIDTPFRVILGIDGARPSDYAEVEGFMRARNREWQMIEWPGFVYYARTVINCLAAVSSEFVAVVPPWVQVNARSWFGRLQQPFTVDPHTMLVVADLDNPPNMNPPFRLEQRIHPRCEMFATRRRIIGDIGPLVALHAEATPETFVEGLSKAAAQLGGTRWIAPAVRAIRVEHNEHTCPQPENSKTDQGQQESPSPTTPSSSTRTITEKDGSGALSP